MKSRIKKEETVIETVSGRDEEKEANSHLMNEILVMRVLWFVGLSFWDVIFLVNYWMDWNVNCVSWWSRWIYDDGFLVPFWWFCVKKKKTENSSALVQEKRPHPLSKPTQSIIPISVNELTSLILYQVHQNQHLINFYYSHLIIISHRIPNISFRLN